jgi:hypothetical protein
MHFGDRSGSPPVADTDCAGHYSVLFSWRWSTFVGGLRAQWQSEARQLQHSHADRCDSIWSIISLSDIICEVFADCDLYAVTSSHRRNYGEPAHGGGEWDRD